MRDSVTILCKSGTPCHAIIIQLWLLFWFPLLIRLFVYACNISCCTHGHVPTHRLGTCVVPGCAIHCCVPIQDYVHVLYLAVLNMAMSMYCTWLYKIWPCAHTDNVHVLYLAVLIMSVCPHINYVPHIDCVHLLPLLNHADVHVLAFLYHTVCFYLYVN